MMPLYDFTKTFNQTYHTSINDMDKAYLTSVFYVSQQYCNPK
jgi:hypothetical protein